jgi:hypothetical protein
MASDPDSMNRKAISITLVIHSPASSNPYLSIRSSLSVGTFLSQHIMVLKKIKERQREFRRELYIYMASADYMNKSA